MRSIFYTLFITALVTVASAFPDHSGTCISDQATIEGVSGSPMGKLVNSLGYNFQITMKNNNYAPKGSPVKFSVTGKTAFMGLLLYAVDSQKNHVGTWNTPTGFKLLTSPQCKGDPSGTLSHADSNLKGPNVDFMWTPPSTDVGPISFIGTIVQTGEAGFQIIKVPTAFTVSGSKVTAPSAPSSDNSTSPTSSNSSNPYNLPSNSATTEPTTTATHSDASSLTRSALLLQLTAAISLLFYYL